jgi:ParB family chromosome partitioning protein
MTITQDPPEAAAAAGDDGRIYLTYMDAADLDTTRNDARRRGAGFDNELFQSIKENGVQQPVIAMRTKDGKIRVRYGHRRTAACAKLGIQVPVLIVGTEGDSKTDRAARLIGQWAENEHRQNLSTADKAVLVQGLLDLGVPEAQLRKKTQLNKKQVAAAKVVLSSAAAGEALAHVPQMTLEMAATFAEFEDDGEAAAELAAAADRGEMAFAHAAQQMRDSAADRAERDALIAHLAGAGVRIADERDVHWNQRLSYLQGGDGKEYTAEMHRGCPGHVAVLRHEYGHAPVATPGAAEPGAQPPDAYAVTDDEAGEAEDPVCAECGTDNWEIVARGSEGDRARCANGHEWVAGDAGHGEAETDWRMTWTVAYYCADPEGNGHTRTASGGSGRAKPETDEDREKASAERRRVVEGNKAWRAARKVRQAWLTAFFTGASVPDGADELLITALVGDDYELRHSIEQGHKLAARLLGLTSSEHGVGRDALIAMIQSAKPSRRKMIGLALVLSGYEEHMDDGVWRIGEKAGDFWRRTPTAAARYLRQLEAFGYGLADCELLVAAILDQPSEGTLGHPPPEITPALGEEP